MNELHHVGSRAPRIDGRDKVTGAAQFVDDIEFGPDLLHAAVVESPHAHARIIEIDTSAAEAMPGVVKVVTLARAHRNGLIQLVPCDEDDPVARAKRAASIVVLRG